MRARRMNVDLRSRGWWRTGVGERELGSLSQELVVQGFIAPAKLELESP